MTRRHLPYHIIDLRTGRLLQRFGSAAEALRSTVDWARAGVAVRVEKAREGRKG